jgi:hydroxysqualene dehydroxylase
VIDAARGRVAVVGGGWAGCAAAVTLAGAGFPVTVIEQARTLGGRARRVVVDGIPLDNGQHVLLGAYRQTQELLALVHPPEELGRLFHRLPLTLRAFGPRRPGQFAFAAWNAPAPLHIAAGLLSARGLSWSERMRLVAGFRSLARNGFRCAEAETVTHAFASTPRRAFAALWEPLCLAALNTPPDRASARVFAHVLRSALAGAARDSDLLVPIVDLSACFPDAAARFIAERGGDVRTRTAVRAVEESTDGVAVATGTDVATYAAAVVAVGPHQLAATVGDDATRTGTWRVPLARAGAFTYESITTIYFGIAGRVPFSAPMLRLDDAPGQWVFDRNPAPIAEAPVGTLSVIAVVISAGGPHDGQDQATLAHDVEAQLRRLAPDLPAVVFSRVIAERRATYACTPGLARPAGGRLGRGIYLAGDYTDPEFPATLEAATRSGVVAARSLIADFAAAAAAHGSIRAP